MALRDLLYASPLALGMTLLVACVVASTSILYFCRPARGPGYWAGCCWLLLLGCALYLGNLAWNRAWLDALAHLLLIMAQACMMLGVFRFLGRALPLWWVPGSALAQGLLEIARGAGLTQPWVDAGYCLIVLAMAIGVADTLSRERSTEGVRSVRNFILLSLAAYALAHALRLVLGVLAGLYGDVYGLFDAGSLVLLSFYSGLPFLVIALVALTAMSLHRTLAQSRAHEASARANLRRFEQLMRISSAALLLLRNGLIEDSNPKLGELFGCRREALQGRAFDSLFEAVDEPMQALGLPAQRLAVRADRSTFQAEVLLLQLDEERSLAEIRDVSRQKHLEAQLTRLANLDPLTGALNRRAFHARFEHARFVTGPVCLALIDLDHFKRINDSCGHAAGDAVLVHFTRLCQASARANDVFARLGGEEFVFLLPACSVDQAQAFLSRLRQALRSSPVAGLPPELQVDFSAGLTLCASHGGLDAVLHQADQALYRAKQNGRGRDEVQA